MDFSTVCNFSKFSKQALKTPQSKKSDFFCKKATKNDDRHKTAKTLKTLKTPITLKTPTVQLQKAFK